MAFQINTTSWATDGRNLTNIAGTDSTSMTSILAELVAENSLATGTTIRANRAGEVSASNTIIEALRIDMVQRGTVNFYCEIRNSNAGAVTTMTLVRYRAGAISTVWTETTSSTTYVTRNSDQTVLPGDAFIFRIVTNAVGTLAYIRNAQIRTSTTSAWIPTGPNSWYHNYS